MFLQMVVFAALGAEPPAATKTIAVDQATVKLISEVRVPATEAGQLVQLGVSEGDIVASGDEIGQIDDELVRIDKELAQLEHEIAEEKAENDIDERHAKKSLEVAQSELKLSLEAVGRVATSVPQVELERLDLVVEKARLAIEQAQRDLHVATLTKQLKQRMIAAAEKRINLRNIRAPLDGMVVEIFAQQGEWVAPGDPVVRIVRLDRLRVEAHLKAAEFGSELKGSQAHFTVAIPGKMRDERFDGVVTFVNPEVEPVTGETRVWVEVNNRELLLRPGVHGRLSISTPARRAK